MWIKGIEKSEFIRSWQETQKEIESFFLSKILLMFGQQTILRKIKIKDDKEGLI